MSQDGALMCWQHKLDLTVDVHAARTARVAITKGLDRVLGSGSRALVVGEVEVIISELVTNTVQAASTRIVVSAELLRGQLRIEVWDDGAGWPRQSVSTPTRSVVGAWRSWSR